MTYLPKGKYVGSIDEDHPRGLGICDGSGFVFRRIDLIRQMEWRGERLIWTGFYVGRPFLDVPNPQNIPPILQPDPIPLFEPRLPQGTLITWETITQPFWEQINFITWDAWGTYQDGFPALTPQQRLENLQQGGYYDTGYSTPGYYPEIVDNALPENVRLELLQNFRWSA